MFKRFKRITSRGHTCEVCKGGHVLRYGIWDHCPKGHIYVGQRVDNPSENG